MLERLGDLVLDLALLVSVKKLTSARNVWGKRVDGKKVLEAENKF